MRTKDFENFKISQKLNIQVDSYLRSITEKIRLISQYSVSRAMHSVVENLSSLDDDLDKIIISNVCNDELEEE